MNEVIKEISAKTNTPGSEVFEALEAAMRQVANVVEALGKTFSEFFNTIQNEAKPKRTSPKQYGMSLMKRQHKNGNYMVYNYIHTVQRRLPYQRRIY